MGLRKSARILSNIREKEQSNSKVNVQQASTLSSQPPASLVRDVKVVLVREQYAALEKSIKKTSKRSYNMPKLEDLVDITFQEQLQIFHKSEKQVEIGDLILARMKGFKPWPARVEGYKNGGKMIMCFFFGTHNSGPVGSKNVIPFCDGFEIVRLICLREPNHYKKAVHEIEIECGMPEELSCLKEFESIKC